MKPKKPMGRPPTRAGMCSGVRVPVFPAERDLVKAAAEAAGLSLARWCREVLVGEAHMRLRSNGKAVG